MLVESGLSRVLFSCTGIGKEEFERHQQPADYEKTIRHIERYLEEKPDYQTAIIQLLVRRDRPEEEVRQFKERWQDKADHVTINYAHTWTGDSDRINDFVQNGLNEQPSSPCPDPWTYMSIHQNGDVVPCCRDGDGDYVLGNIMETTLEELWNSEKLVALREKHLTMNRAAIGASCENCPKSMENNI